jgi:aryl-alcohol dehydrogenase-like predicted oxidoreductase
MGDDPNQRGASRRWITTAVEGSLRRLQTDHIHLYRIQRPDPDTDIEETLSALTDLIRSGKVRAIGPSMMPASDIVESHWVAERHGLERFHTELASIRDALDGHSRRSRSCRSFDIEWCPG